MQAHFISHGHINRSKWDACIRDAVNGLVYAEAAYLSAMADNWDALVIGDYTYVMPLTWRKKWGIKYLYQPAFVQQLGIFGREPVTAAVQESFLKEASCHFSFAEITLNTGNLLNALPVHFSSAERTNFCILLKDGYASISDRYHQDVKQSLSKAASFGIEMIEGDSIASAIEWYRILYGERLPAFSEADYRNFESLCLHYQQQNRLLIRQIRKTNSSELLALALLIEDEHRYYNLISCVSQEGRALFANYFLYDGLVRELNGKTKLLDLEGSDVPGIAFFYSKLSSIKESYPFIRYNRLPAPIRIFKP